MELVQGALEVPVGHLEHAEGPYGGRKGLGLHWPGELGCRLEAVSGRLAYADMGHWPQRGHVAGQLRRLQRNANDLARHRGQCGHLRGDSWAEELGCGEIRGTVL